MKKYKNWLIFCAALLLLGGVAVWRLWPRSLDSVMEMGEKPVDRVSCSFHDWTWEAGLANSDFYTFESESAEDFAGLMEILQASRYQEDFRNLLPWDSGLSSNSARWLDVVAFSDGKGQDRYCTVTLLGQEACRIGGRRVHPTDGQLFERLADYLREHGALAPKTGPEVARMVTDAVYSLGAAGAAVCEAAQGMDS